MRIRTRFPIIHSFYSIVQMIIVQAVNGHNNYIMHYTGGVWKHGGEEQL